jgi:putative thioredoxin
VVSDSDWVKDVGDEDFESAVLERSQSVPVVVDFWAEWCGPCRILGPTLEKLAEEGKGSFILAKVDVESAPRLSQAFGIRSIPHVMAFRGGEPIAEFRGALPEDAVRQFLRRVVPSEADRLVEQGDAAREEQPEAAESLYRRALELDDQHEVARVALAEILLDRGDSDAVAPLIENLVPSGELSERIEHLRSEVALRSMSAAGDEEELRAKLRENPKDGESLCDLGALLASRREFKEALELLLEAARNDRSLAQGRAKELMVEIFHVVGVRSELADEYRTQLARLLY